MKFLNKKNLFEKIKKDLNESMSLKKNIIEKNIDQIIQASNICVNSIRKGGKIIFCGNGGSASDAHHLSTELLVRLRPNVNRKPIASMSLNLDTNFH